jgi:hypothetical protein
VESGVRSVETQLNEAGNSPAVATGAVSEAGANVPTQPAVLPDAAPAPPTSPASAGEPPRQGALPGFDRI